MAKSDEHTGDSSPAKYTEEHSRLSEASAGITKEKTGFLFAVELHRIKPRVGNIHDAHIVRNIA